MSKGTAVCLFTSIVAFILGVLALSLPYWFYERNSQSTKHGGLWRNCTVFSNTFRCKTTFIDKTWFHLVQSFMVIGVAGQLLTVVLSCMYQKTTYTFRVARAYALLSILSGVILAAAVIIYGVNNRQYSLYFNGGFYLAMVASFLSLLAALMSWIVNLSERRGTLECYTRIGF